jgi:hypothetical protein
MASDTIPTASTPTNHCHLICACKERRKEGRHEFQLAWESIAYTPRRLETRWWNRFIGIGGDDATLIIRFVDWYNS